jgi:gliding motility-associated-like protein
MRIFISILLITVLYADIRAQDFSNKGKDFWLCFPSHVPNKRGTTTFFAKMSLFITAEKNSSGIVTVPGVFSSSFSVTAGQVAEIDIPYSIAHITTAESGTVVRKGINVKVDAGKPAVVVYSHIYAGFRSAASLILPSAVLGKKYYSMNAPQLSVDGSKSQFVVVAKEANTTVSITPVRDGVKGSSFTVPLPVPGDLYELQDDKDLTGSIIESISLNADPCKNIAVFSGSSGINISTGIGCQFDPSYDPLYQQLYPVAAWGKDYGFIPLQNYTNGNPYRVLAAEDNTTVKENGTTVAVLNAGEFYPTNSLFSQLHTNSFLISASKPVSVAQYAQGSACNGATPPVNQGYGDPDMVLLNPVEQNVNNITVFSSNKENIYPDSKFINVMLKDIAVPSFTINGTAPATTWQPVQPPGSGYSFSKINLPAGLSSFNLKADSSFNAIAYGFGDYESYGYSAGTNIKDLYRAIKIENEFGNGTDPISCTKSSFKISFTFPYIPLNVKVLFYGALPDETITAPVPVESFDVNGRTVYRFRLAGTYNINTVGSFPVTLIAENTTLVGCNNGIDEVDYEINIVERPKADWSFSSNGCVNEQVLFKDAVKDNGSKMVKWHWRFGDSGTSEDKDIAHTYGAGDDYTVDHWAVNDIGCGTDTATKVISLTEVPIAAFTEVDPLICEKSLISFKDQSSVAGKASIVNRQWNFGDNTQPLSITQQLVDHYFANAGPYNVLLKVITGSGCESIPQGKNIKVNAKPVANFTIPRFCLPSGTGTFINTSSISDGTEALLKYSWEFADNNSISADKDPAHQYYNKGPHNVKLTATSSAGCKDDSLVSVNTIYSQAKIPVIANAENCLGDPSVVTVNLLPLANNALSNVYWRKDLAGTFLANAVQAGLSGLPLQTIFNTPGMHTVEIYGEAAATGCYTDTVTKNIYVNKLPSPVFSLTGPACDGRVVRFTDASVPNDGILKKWNWDFSKGIVSDKQDPEKILNKGSYDVTLSVETDKGCKAASATQKIIVTDIPVADFATPEICLNDPVAQFINKSGIADGSASQLSYSWNFDDANANAGNPNTSLAKDGQHKYSSVNTFNVKLAATSKDGCMADTTKAFVVNGIKPVAKFSVISSNPICSNNEFIIKNESEVDFGSIIRTEIYWDNTQPSPAVDEEPVKNRIYKNKYPAIANTDKNYTLRYIVYSGITCMSEITKTVLVKASPVLKFDQPAAICENTDPIKIEGVTEITGIAGKGIFTGRGISSEGVFSPRVAKAGNHILWYTFAADNGCRDSLKNNISVLPSPYINAGPDKVAAEGTKVTLNGYASGSAAKYRWSPPDFMDDRTILTPKVSPLYDIVYKLNAVSEKGCTAVDSVSIKIISKIFVPTAFTPDNNGKNDVWNIPDINAYEDCIVQVFNRWGQCVFSSKGYQTPWNGNYKGIPLDTGVYVWLIDLKNGKKIMKGTVTIIR